MKKILSLLLSVSIIFSSSVAVSGIENTINKVEAVDFNTFVSGVSDLIDEHDDSIEDDISDSSALKYGNSDTFVTEATDTESTNRLIVKSEHTIDTLDAVGYVSGYDDLHILQFDNNEDLQDAYDYYSELECVEYVQEDGYIYESEVTESTFTEASINYPTQYQSDFFGYSNAKKNMASGKVTVAVVDSGVAYDHEMLVGRVDTEGFDSIDNNSCYDTRGHGTHVAGIIVANTKSNVRVRSYRVLNKAGEGTDTQVYLGIQAAIEDGVDIINLSLSKKGDSEILREVIKEAYDAGITVVAAAGNADDDIGKTTYTPSSFPEVISAVSIDTNKEKATTSNWGSTKDLAAPGVNILSSHLNNTYKVQSGTSMASPFIAAAASYLLASNSSMTPDQVFSTLYESTLRGVGTYNIRYVCPGTLINSGSACPNPVFTPSSVSFAGYTTVELSCSYANAEILYRTSDMANKTWLSYNGPISVDETTTITAFAICESKLNSAEVTVKFTKSSFDPSAFEVDENGVLVGFTGEDTVITIPEFYNGRAITGIGSDAFRGNENITSVTLPDTVTSIADNAFAGCSSLVTFNAPSVTAIGEGAFADCSSLATFNAASLTVIDGGIFDGCENLQTLDLRSVTTINGTMSGCTNLTTVNLSSVKQLPDEVFMNCTQLKTLTLSALEVVGERAFYGCISLKTVSLPLVTIIGDEAFYGCSGMTDLTSPKLASIGESAFENASVSSVNLNNIVEIGARAFYNSGIISVSFNTTPSIGASAFEGCEKLTTVQMNSVTTLAERVFANCTALTTATMPNLREFSAYAFYNCEKLSNVTWADTYLRSIGDYCFYNCDSIVSFDFKSLNLSYLGESAFRNCTGITSVKFKDSGSCFTVIYDNTFAGCTSLESIAIPDAVLNINREAFLGCNSLKYVFYSGDSTSWSSVVIGSSNTALLSSYIHYSSTTHTKTTQSQSATCTKEGYSVTTCKYCDFKEEKILPLANHSGADTTVNATCTEDGYRIFKCFNCSYTRIEAVYTARGHSYASTTVAPTCTVDGYEANECTECGYKTDTIVIPATGHSYSDEWTIDVQPACGVEGSKSRHCTVCGDKTDITVIPAVSSHTYSGSWLIDYNATCTEDGLKYRVCTGCGKGIETQVIPALGHSLDTGWWDDIEATCTEPGREKAECSRCGEYTYRDTPPYGHEFSNRYTIDVQATCTTDGLKSRHCEYCEERTDETVIVATGHIYPEEWTVEVDATCYEPGTKVKQCNGCTEKLTEEIPTLGHIYEDEWTVDIEPGCDTQGSKSRHCVNCDDKTDIISIPATGHDYPEEWIIDIAPTCTEDGYKYHKCNNCGDIKDKTVIQALGHTIVGDVCIVCGYNTVFDIILYDDYAVINKYLGSYSEVVIPAEYEGLPVTDINSEAFRGCTFVTSVIIPDSVFEIGSYAFYGCVGLKNVKMSSQLEHIGDYAFYNCSNLNSIELPDSLKTIGNTVFYGCKELTEITIPDSVSSMGNGVFSGCLKLADVRIGTGLITLSNSVFYNCSSIKRVVIPAGVTSIGNYAFSGCSSLEEISIPSTVTSVGTTAFSSCNKLKYVFYSGTEDAWKNIAIKSGNTALTSASIHYNATDHSYEYTIITEPTCTTDGLRETKCNVCGLHIESDVVPATGHSYSTEWIVEVEPTCTTDGYRSAECSLCEEKITETLPATGHDYPDEWTGTDATCTEDGYKTKTCGNCGDVIEESVPAFGHDYPDEWTVVEPTCTEDGHKTKICGNCGDTINETLPSKGHAYPDEWTVVEPTCTEDGYKSKICGNCGDVVSEVILSSGHDYSEEWTIDVTVTCTENGEKSHHCSVCGDRADITVIESTGHNFIVHDEHNGHPHTISYICDNCDEPKIETPYVDDCVYCNYTVTVTASGDFKLLSYKATQTDAIVPANYMDGAVLTIANGCFKGNTRIKSVTIEEGVTSIGSLAFMNCSSLERVVIPDSVTIIGAQAFYGFTGTIYCSSGSAAHQYAVNNNIKYVLNTNDEPESPIQDTTDTQVDYDNFIIKTNVCLGKDVTDILDLSESAVAIAEASYIYGDTEVFGTGTKITVFDGNKFIGEFVLVVNGDVNGDSVCDALDAAQIVKVSNGFTDLDGAYAMAADSNSDDIVDIEDYQAIVNKVIA